MSLLAILGLQTIAAISARLSRLRLAAWFLWISLLSDLIRTEFSLLRKGFPRPFNGLGLVWWLPDPVGTLAIPSVLFALVFGWRKGLILWVVAFGIVSLSYPTLRGENLLRFYWAFDGAVYSVATFCLVRQSSMRKISKDEAMLVLFGLVGLGDLVMIHMFGVSQWYGNWIVNGIAYVVVTAVSILEIWTRGFSRLDVHVQRRDQ